MKALIQRVQRASVAVNQTIVGQIQKGFLIFLGVAKDDTSREADVLLKKCLQLRIFEDENGKSNLSLSDVKGELLIISQFTLYADCHKGNRPSFIHAGDPQKAEQLYQYFVEQAKQSRLKVQQGEFGADMKVELLNDGPFTVLLEVEDGKVKALAAGD